MARTIISIIMRNIATIVLFVILPVMFGNIMRMKMEMVGAIMTAAM